MKKWMSFILIICLTLSVAGCSQVSGAGRTIYYEGNEIPVNIDPLLAQSPTELIAVQHLFEPLLLVDENGMIQPAAAAGYIPGDDGLSYTFTLREDLIWSDGEPVTAADFAFALQRALSPETKAACAGQLSMIAGGAEVQAGNAPADTLGVHATDAITLTITLSSPDAGLLSALAGVAGMPCRRDFFESCGGRYGMGKDYIVSNGGFAVSRWSQAENEESLRLTKQEDYHGADSILPSGIIMTFGSQSDRLFRMSQGDVDCAVLSEELLEDAAQEDFNTLSYFSDSYSLVFNTDKKAATGNADLRKALVGAVDKSNLSSYLPASCEQADSLILPGKYYGTKLYSAPDSGHATLRTAAKNNFQKALEMVDTDSVKNLTLCYEDVEGIRTIVDYLVQCWQKEFGIYVTLSAVSQSALNANIADRQFDIALCAMGNSSKNILEIFEQFGTKADSPYSGLAGKQLDTLLAKTKKSGENDLTAQQQCEQLLQTSCVVFPVFYIREYYVYSPKLSGLAINSYSQVLDFTNVGKMD